MTALITAVLGYDIRLQTTTAFRIDDSGRGCGVRQRKQFITTSKSPHPVITTNNKTNQVKYAIRSTNPGGL